MNEINQIFTTRLARPQKDSDGISAKDTSGDIQVFGQCGAPDTQYGTLRSADTFERKEKSVPLNNSTTKNHKLNFYDNWKKKTDSKDGDIEDEYMQAKKRREELFAEREKGKTVSVETTGEINKTYVKKDESSVDFCTRWNGEYIGKDGNRYGNTTKEQKDAYEQWREKMAHNKVDEKLENRMKRTDEYNGPWNGKL